VSEFFGVNVLVITRLVLFGARCVNVVVVVVWCNLLAFPLMKSGALNLRVSNILTTSGH